MATFVAKTARFWIEADPALGITAVQSGQMVAGLCESDYDRLVMWFGGGVQVPYQSPDAPGFIKVLITDVNGNGWNNGSGGLIKLSPYPEAESMGLIFVAELSEMFMLAQGGGWDPGDSKGEALSRLLGEAAHPTAPNAGLFFTAQSWLGSPEDPAGSGNRHDWISANEGTDKNFVSTGCALLLLNFLRFQPPNAFSVEEIVAASGTTPEAVYAELVGQPGAFQPLSSLLNRFFPVGTHPATGDNPFPLLDAQERQISISINSAGAGIKLEGGGFVERRFIGCPLKSYSYSLLGTTNTITAVAEPFGFGIANIAWTVNGVAATDGATINPTVIVFNPDPALPAGGTSSTRTVDLKCTFSNLGKSLTLSLEGADLIGQVQLTISAVATDANDAPSWQVSASTTATLATEIVQFEPDYQKDAARCASAFLHRWGKVAPPFDHLAQAIAIILTLPDPPPPDFQRALILVEQIALLSERLHEVEHLELREQLERFLSSRLAATPTVAGRIFRRERGRVGTPETVE
jgi:hypothetical protein